MLLSIPPPLALSAIRFLCDQQHLLASLVVGKSAGVGVGGITASFDERPAKSRVIC